jgi:hypothetical protein
VRKNGGAAGLDGESPDAIERSRVEQFLATIEADLRGLPTSSGEPSIALHTARALLSVSKLRFQPSKAAEQRPSLRRVRDIRAHGSSGGSDADARRGRRLASGSL